MYACSIHTMHNEKHANILLVRPSLTMLRAEAAAIGLWSAIGWFITDNKGLMSEGENYMTCLSVDSKEFDIIDVSFYPRFS